MSAFLLGTQVSPARAAFGGGSALKPGPPLRPHPHFPASSLSPWTPAHLHLSHSDAPSMTRPKESLLDAITKLTNFVRPTRSASASINNRNPEVDRQPESFTTSLQLLPGLRQPLPAYPQLHPQLLLADLRPLHSAPACPPPLASRRSGRVPLVCFFSPVLRRAPRTVQSTEIRQAAGRRKTVKYATTSADQSTDRQPEIRLSLRNVTICI